MFKKKNLAYGTLSSNLVASGLAFSLQSGEGIRFPETGSGNLFIGVFWGASYASPHLDATSEFVIAYKESSDYFIAQRGRENTVAQSWSANDNFMLTSSKATFEEIEELILPKSGGEMSGHIQLGENSIALKGLLSGDEKWSGTTTSGILGATIQRGNLCYLSVTDSRWELTDANSVNCFDKQLGICLNEGNDGSPSNMLLYGKIRSATFPSFIVASGLFMSETPGMITQTPPVTSDSCTRKLGFAITAEDILFNPSNDFYTHI